MGRLYIYLRLVDLYGIHVGKYTSHMDPMGNAKKMCCKEVL